MAHIILRSIRLTDKPSFARWWRDDDLLALTSGDPNKISDTEVDRYFSAMLNAKNDYHFIIECGGTTIGHISLNQQRSDWYETQIVIGEKEYWDKGYGTIAITKLLEFAEQKQINKIYLEVRPDNQRAIAAYKKCGFKEIKTIHRAKEPYLKDVTRMEYVKRNL